VNNLEVAALALTGLWLGVLTIVVVLLVRQLGLVTLRLELGGLSTPPSDGPDIGTSIPHEVSERLPQLGQGLNYLLLVSPTCVPCHELAPQLSAVAIEAPARALALVPGSSEIADDFVPMLPVWYEVVRDPVATAVANALEMERTPAVLELEDGVVTGKAYVLRAADLQNLVDARARSDAADIARQAKEVGDHVA
jgi:thiol-disulfide isomerase/thioredoxin